MKFDKNITLAKFFLSKTDVFQWEKKLLWCKKKTHPKGWKDEGIQDKRKQL